MKKISVKSLTLVSVLITSFIFTDCTDQFEDINKDPNGVFNEDLIPDFNNVGFPLKQAQMYIYLNDPAWNTQLQQNLIADVYSGYMTPPTPFAGNVNNITYALVAGWNTFPWDDAYDGVMKPISKVQQLSKDVYDDFYAWSQIIKIEAMHRVTDIYGPIIYSQFGKTSEDGSTNYDSQKDVYYAFFEELDEAITLLTPYAQNEADIPANFKAFDLVYGGSYTQWIKFANTLRLRLAMRISNVEPNKAQEEGEKSLNNPFGLLTVNADNFLVSIPTSHPLNVISGSWGDIRMNAVMESFLGGYEDPRVAKYFLPATDAAVKGQFKGIRAGVDIDAKTRYVGYSALAPLESKIQLMTAAEAWFLKAEAALKGWSNAGSAEDNYKKGVQISFEQRGVGSADGYLASAHKPKPYLDPKSGIDTTYTEPGHIMHIDTVNNVSSLHDSDYLSTITPTWDNGAGDEENLERIITQKWIAMFPEGQEAWSEFRRTGYPQLFPVVINQSGGEISTTEFIKRIKFSANEYSTNPGGVQTGIDHLNGPDTGGTPLWWDID